MPGCAKVGQKVVIAATAHHSAAPMCWTLSTGGSHQERRWQSQGGRGEDVCSRWSLRGQQQPSQHSGGRRPATWSRKKLTLAQWQPIALSVKNKLDLKTICVFTTVSFAEFTNILAFCNYVARGGYPERDFEFSRGLPSPLIILSLFDVYYSKLRKIYLCAHPKPSDDLLRDSANVIQISTWKILLKVLNNC